ncbi:MAG: hypothetical protein IKD97_06135 [Firmicutes bacterium]|nr:hypothetical protein [Bacillota bacterium]
MLFNEVTANINGAVGAYVQGNERNNPKYCEPAGENNPYTPGCGDLTPVGNGCIKPWKPWINPEPIFLGNDCVAFKP